MQKGTAAMIGQKRRIVLASSSPRRKELLAEMGYVFTVCAPSVDENIAGLPRDQVLMLAIKKADAACPVCPDAIVICADTLVALDGEALGKPKDERDAKNMIMRLSGRAHEVLTGLCVTDTEDGTRQVCVCSTEVVFRPITEEEADNYVSSGEPFGKAGAYAIQGTGGRFVESLNGSRNNVIGLPTEMLQVILTDLLDR